MNYWGLPHRGLPEHQAQVIDGDGQLHLFRKAAAVLGRY